MRRSPKPRARAADDGFTLLEAMIALALIALIVTAYLGIRTTAVGDGVEARNWRLARELAEEKMSELQAGARETPPQYGTTIPFEKYPDFAYEIVRGETAIGELESKIADEAAADDKKAGERVDWQRNRDTYKKASSQGKSYQDYQDQLAKEDYERQMDQKAPDESELEDVAVAVFFPKLDYRYEGQKETFVLKAKASTLALSGLTPEQAKMVAESKGLTTGDGTAGAQTPGGSNSGSGGSNSNSGGK